MSKEIKLDVDKDSFKKVLDGEKDFEVRLDHYNIKKGDVVILREEDREKEVGFLTGREIKKKVNCVVKTKDLNYWSEKEINKKGFLVVGF